MGKTLMAALLLGLGWSSMGGKPARPKRRTVYQTVTGDLPSGEEIIEGVADVLVDIGEGAAKTTKKARDVVVTTYEEALEDVITAVENSQMDTIRIMGGPQGIVPDTYDPPIETSRVMGGPQGITRGPIAIALGRIDDWWNRMTSTTPYGTGSTGSDVRQY